MRDRRLLIRIAAAVPIGSEIATTASATSTVLRVEVHIRWSFQRSMNQRSVRPTQG